MSATRALLVAAACALGVGGCNCGSSDGAGDAARDMVSRDSRRIDSMTPDRGVDTRSPYDLYPAGAWGGSRTLQPVEIPAGKPEGCGAGCERITWGADVDQRYEVVGDLLVYVGKLSSGKGHRLYLKRLGDGKEYRVSSGMWEVSGCSLATTDGTLIYTTCVRSDIELGYWTRSITRFTPATNLEEDLACFARTAAQDGCYPDHIALADAGVLLQYTLGKCQEQAPYLLRPGSTKLENLAGVVRDAQLPAASGRRIVWTQRKPSEWGYNYQIVLYDDATKTQRRIAPTTASQWDPRIDGDRIVWLDNRNDPNHSYVDPKNVDIYVHNLSTGKTQAVTVNPGRQDKPDVGGKWVAWHDYRNGPDGVSGKEIDIYAKNLETGVEYRVTAEGGIEAYPRVDGERLFFRKLRSGQLALHMVDLPTFVKAQKP
jgi:beta propeller repeat protein